MQLRTFEFLMETGWQVAISTWQLPPVLPLWAPNCYLEEWQLPFLFERYMQGLFTCVKSGRVSPHPIDIRGHGVPYDMKRPE